MQRPGTRVGPFEVVSQLGAGGMGEVYRARDPRLEREVALKVLPAVALTNATARARLLREARMAARLGHPNICTVHEVGEDAGQVYIAMELVAGRSLAERLDGGALAPQEVVRYGVQIAGALAHAHARGVVHRDLKSGNVVVTPEGQVKVLDFGLAKALVGDEPLDRSATTEEALTAVGAVAGTPAYMAPEQLRGEAADARSDIWALGVVLHEMASGERPFRGSTGYELSSAILTAAPPPLPAAAPAGLAAVVGRCLAKAPGERYQRAEEVQAALEAVQSGGAIPGIPGRRLLGRAAHRWWRPAAAAAAVVLAVLAALDVGGMRRILFGGGGQAQAVRMAVLPFVNLTGDPEQEYLADGMTQEMISQLGRLHPGGLSVIARSSVMRYKGGDTPIDQVGRELDVQYVLEGSARREGNRLRITTELVNTGDQTQLWAETYERELSGILALQSEVAEQVAEALALQLLPAEQERLASVRPVNPEAYEAYLKGMYHAMKATPEDLVTAETYFDQALKEDASFAPAWAGRAWVWTMRNQTGITSTDEAGPKAKAAALRAIELDPTSVDAHFVLASVRTYIDWDWDGAGASWRRTLELNPNLASAHGVYAHFLAITGHMEETLVHSEKAAVLDPFNPLVLSWHAQVFSMHHRYEEALAVAREAQRMHPDHPIVSWTLWMVMNELGGSEQEALEAITAALVAIYQDPGIAAALDEGYAQGGYAEAMQRGAEALIARLPQAFSLPNDIANFYLAAGEKDTAIGWLEEGLEVRDPVLPYLNCFPIYDEIRSDPRIQEILHRIGLVPA